MVKGYRGNISAYYYVKVRMLHNDLTTCHSGKEKQQKQRKDQLFSGNRVEGEMKG